jgi:hypothetical protein
LAQTAAQLPTVGAREQARWVTINSFAPVPEEFRIDSVWVASIAPNTQVDVVVELQPLLTVVEADEVMRAVLALLNRQSDEALTGAGTDFSGRHWYRGRATKKSLLAIARQLFSVEALHRPMEVLVAAGPQRGRRHVAELATPTAAQIAALPIVGVVDGGIPAGHPILAQYARGQYLDPNSDGVLGEHGSLVASRVVFGDLDFSGGVEAPPPGACRFLDVVVSEGTHHINSKSVVPAMEAVVAAFPDVRVFNCSFGSKLPLSGLGDVDRREALIAMRDLDNFVFARDVVVIVAAGNSPEGVVPTSAPYPDHFSEAEWQLGTFCQGFNTLTCGSTVGRVHPHGLARNLHWPSPFTRVGLGSRAHRFRTSPRLVETQPAPIDTPRGRTDAGLHTPLHCSRVKLLLQCNTFRACVSRVLGRSAQRSKHSSRSPPIASSFPQEFSRSLNALSGADMRAQADYNALAPIQLSSCGKGSWRARRTLRGFSFRSQSSGSRKLTRQSCG